MIPISIPSPPKNKSPVVKSLDTYTYTRRKEEQEEDTISIFPRVRVETQLSIIIRPNHVRRLSPSPGPGIRRSDCHHSPESSILVPRAAETIQPNAWCHHFDAPMRRQRQRRAPVCSRPSNVLEREDPVSRRPLPPSQRGFASKKNGC